MFLKLLGWIKSTIFIVVSVVLFALASICFFVSLIILLPWGIMYWQLAKSELKKEEACLGDDPIKGNKRDYIRLVRANED